MRLFLLIIVLVVGCDGSASAPKREGAKLIDDIVAEKPIAVGGEKPAATSDAAKVAIAALLDAHTDRNPKALDAFRHCVIRRKGEFDQGGASVNAECVERYAWPDRYRGEWTLSGQMTILAIGDAVSAGKPGDAQAKEMDPTQTNSNLEDIRGQWMTILVPLKDEGRVRAEVAEKDLRVWIGNQPPVVLVTDPQTNLLAKVLFEKVGDGRRETWSFVTSEYKTVRGVKLPGKVVYTPGRRAGATWLSIEYEAADSFPATTFTKP